MITFELDPSKKGLEIYIKNEKYDEVDQLINILKYVKEHQDSFHLTVGNELDEKLNNPNNTLIKHIKIWSPV